MEEVFIYEGKTVNEAIENGIKELKTTRNNIEVKVIEEENKKTFFSILEPKKVKVEIKLKSNIKKQEEDENIEKIDISVIISKIDEVMKEFISIMNKEDISYIVKLEEEKIKVNINGKDASILIGYRGETMNSLQNIITYIANKQSNYRIKVELNINNYRDERVQDLKNLAKRIANTVVTKQKSIKLEPMNAFDRKVIHTELQNNEYVTTKSVGEEPFRKVIVSLK